MFFPQRFLVTVASVVLSAGLFAPTAAARNGGIYVEIAPAYGFFFADEVVVENGGDSGSDSPVNGFVPQLKLGVTLFGVAGVEAEAAAFGWDLFQEKRGGGGYVGGAVRLLPLEVLSYILPDTVEIPSLIPAGPVTWKDRPFDIGIILGGGYTLVGENYAYQGGYFKWGVDLKVYVTPNFAVGLELPFRHMFYENFRYTNYADSLGLCTDGGAATGRNGNVIAPSPLRNREDEFTRDEAETACTGAAPQGWVMTPALTISGVIDFGI